MQRELDDAQWSAIYAPKIGDSFTTAQGSTWVRLVCSGCALSSHPQPVWAQRGTGTAMCQRCQEFQHEAREEPLQCLLAPNKGIGRMYLSSMQYHGGRFGQRAGEQSYE